MQAFTGTPFLHFCKQSVSSYVLISIYILEILWGTGAIDVVVQSFIVRIYRFDNGRDSLAGTILNPESDTTRTFRGFDELWSTLNILVKQRDDELKGD